MMAAIDTYALMTMPGCTLSRMLATTPPGLCLVLLMALALGDCRQELRALRCQEH